MIKYIHIFSSTIFYSDFKKGTQKNTGAWNKERQVNVINKIG